MGSVASTSSSGAPSGPRFRSSLGALAAMVGVAVGLGNVWRFPYMVGRYGGAAFVAVYLAAVLALGVPAIVAEWSLGRATREGPTRAYRSSGLPGGRAVGLFLFVVVFMATSYYNVVVGWVLRDLQAALAGSLLPREGPPLDPTADPLPLQLAAAAAVLAGVVLVLRRGVVRGIEAASRAGVPLLFLLLGVLLVRALLLPGARKGIAFYLRPDWSRLGGDVVLAATGQAFFSLGLGGTFYVLYGSYLPDETDLPGTALATALGDSLAALLAGLVVLPSAFALGVEPTAGPPLVFRTLPGIFARTPAGGAVAAAFFLLLFVAAFLSMVSAVQVLATAVEGRLGLSRDRSLAAVALALLAAGVPAIRSPEYLALSDLVWGSTLTPLGSVFALLAVGYCLGRGRALAEARRGSRLPVPQFWVVWIRTVLPAAVVAILLWGWIGR